MPQRCMSHGVEANMSPPILHMRDGHSCTLCFWSFQLLVTQGLGLQRCSAHVWPSCMCIRLPQLSNKQLCLVLSWGSLMRRCNHRMCGLGFSSLARAGVLGAGLGKSGDDVPDGVTCRRGFSYPSSGSICPSGSSSVEYRSCTTLMMPLDGSIKLFSSLHFSSTQLSCRVKGWI